VACLAGATAAARVGGTDLVEVLNDVLGVHDRQDRVHLAAHDARMRPRERHTATSCGVHEAAHEAARSAGPRWGGAGRRLRLRLDRLVHEKGLRDGSRVGHASSFDQDRVEPRLHLVEDLAS